MEESLGLSNPECDLVSLFQVMAQELPVPQVLGISQIAGILPKVLVNLLPYCIRDSGRSSRTTIIVQPFHTAGIVYIYPVLDSCRGVPQDLRYLVTIVTL